MRPVKVQIKTDLKNQMPTEWIRNQQANNHMKLYIYNMDPNSTWMINQLAVEMIPAAAVERQQLQLKYMSGYKNDERILWMEQR